MTAAYLQTRKPVEPAKSLVVHVVIAGPCVTLVVEVESPASVSRMLLRKFRQAQGYLCIFLRLAAGNFAR